jgi:hypothetical protein
VNDNGTQNTPPTNTDATGKEEDTQVSPDSSATVTKTYSEGLLFRSNGDGTCAVAGIGTCNAACVLIPPKSPAGDTVTEILPYAFANTIIGAIELPWTVTTVSAASFANCPRLALVRVESGNTSFLEHDGVLYTADGKTLLFCPAGRTGSELRLHDNIRRIAAAAFCECKSITTVHFNGTAAEWQALIVGDGNEALWAAGMKFAG